MSWKIGFGSCLEKSSMAHFGYAAVKRDIRKFVLLGDTPYVNNTVTRNGVTANKAVYNSTVEDILAHYTQMHADQAMIYLRNNVDELMAMMDDHEWGGDNNDGTIHQYCQQNPIKGADTTECLATLSQLEADNHGSVCMQAFQQACALYYDNPVNNDPEAQPQKPPAADASTPDSAFPVTYFRQGYDVDGNRVDSNPHVELFVPNMCAHRSPIADADTAAKSIYGTTQAAWFEKYVPESTANFIIFGSSKKQYKNATSDNGDTQGEYTTERDAHFTLFATNPAAKSYHLGDRHTPAIMRVGDYLGVMACPAGVPFNATAAATTLDGFTTQIWLDGEQVFSEIDVFEDKIIHRVVSAYDANKVKFEIQQNLDGSFSKPGRRYY